MVNEWRWCVLYVLVYKSTDRILEYAAQPSLIHPLVCSMLMSACWEASPFITHVSVIISIADFSSNW